MGKHFEVSLLASDHTCGLCEIDNLVMCRSSAPRRVNAMRRAWDLVTPLLESMYVPVQVVSRLRDGLHKTKDRVTAMISECDQYYGPVAFGPAQLIQDV